MEEIQSEERRLAETPSKASRLALIGAVNVPFVAVEAAWLGGGWFTVGVLNIHVCEFLTPELLFPSLCAGPGRHRGRERAAQTGEQNSAQSRGSADKVGPAQTGRPPRLPKNAASCRRLSSWAFISV